MSLTIYQIESTLNLHGAINTTTAKNLKKHCESIFKNANELTINIDHVSFIDGDGLNALKNVYQKALKNKKQFYITGNGCKEIFDDFRSGTIAA